MTMKCALSLAVLFPYSGMFAQEAGLIHGLFRRRYQEGERLVYRMKASNNGQHYEAQATGVVKKDSSGAFIEEYEWSNITANGVQVDLSPASAQFRQKLSLEPGKAPAIPSLTGVHRTLIGPITDFLTFYADLWLAARVDKLRRAGDRVFYPHGTPASWADGNHVVIGEDSIDFDISLAQVDAHRKVAKLLIRHVPPKNPQVKLPAVWMHQPVADTPNNWVNVIRNGDKCVAAVGKETFDVQITVNLLKGEIVSGTIENSVIARERDCQDAALTNCGDTRPRQILRHIEISLVR